jgi:hypothetical protein
VEANDQITITPYEIRTDKPVEKPTKKNGSKTNNNLMATGSENKDSRKNAKNDLNEVEKTKTIEWITQYFKDNNIKEINLVDNELVIKNDNNKTISAKENHELRNIENQLSRKNLKLEELQNLLDNNNSPSSNSTSDSPRKDYTPYLVGGVIGIGLTIILIVSFYW